MSRTVDFNSLSRPYVRRERRRAGVLLALLGFVVGLMVCFDALAAAGPAPVVPLEALPIQTQLAIEASQAEKAQRSPTERKLDSQLVQTLRAAGVLAAPAGAGLQDQLAPQVILNQPLLLDLYGVRDATVVPWIIQRGGVVVQNHPAQGFLRIRIAPELLMPLAQLPGVRHVRLADEASTQVIKNRSEGDITHGANIARTKYRVDGSGIKVGVLSDSVDHLAQVQATGDLPAINILPGQQGSGSGEGTAMLEIVHDLVPGAELYFATAFNGMAGFAENIRALHAAGCRIIVDDVIYFRESPFQDDLVAQAVADVCAQGTLYFASAGNSGNFNDGTSGTWEGDFVDGGPAALGLRGGRVHSFGSANFNTLLTGGGFRRIDFFWSDPLGGSANDYDVYVVDPSGAIRGSSTNVQDGDDDPYEFISAGNPGDRIVVVKVRGQGRFLHLATGRGRLAIPTPGATRGHNASPVANAFGVGAVWVGAVPSLFQGGSINPGELFSSDGPRIMFYQRDGTPFTPGNVSASGGRIFGQPRLSAADGVKTATPDFEPFFGTSAAAPHAAALAALAWSYNPSMTADQLRTALTNSAVDIEAPGYDRDSGHGLVMAEALIRSVIQPQPRLVVESISLEDGNLNGHLDANECGLVRVTLRNLLAEAGPTAQGVTGRLVSTTPALIVGPRERQWPDIAPQTVSSNTVAFRISTTDLLACDRPVTFELRVRAANMAEVVLPLTLPTATGLSGTPVNFAATDVPMALPDESTIESAVEVSGLSSPLRAVAVNVYLEHSYDSDVVMKLVAPDGTEVLLSANQGASDANYGLSCSVPTRFSDDAPAAISGASAPFAGAYRPQESLSVFGAWEPQRANGIWKLRVSDIADADSGILRCWSLELTPVLCEDGGGRCLVPPSIVSQPVGVTNLVGGFARFEVVAGGAAPFSYEWYFNGTNRIAGATDPVLQLNGIQLGQSGLYSVVVSNFLGLATSAPAMLLVATPPVIVSQPSDVTSIAGNPAALTVGAEGTPPLRYQWLTESGLPVIGATNATLIYPEVLPSNAGRYAVAVSSPYGSVTSLVAVIQVLVPPTFTSQPSDLSAVLGNPAALAAVVTGTSPISYQWYFNLSTPIPGATNPVLGIASVAAPNEGTYQLEVSNIAGTVRSRVARLSLLVPAGFSSVPTSQQVAKGSTLSLTSVGFGTPPLVYQWYRVKAGVTNSLVSQTAPQLNLPSVQPTDTADYFVVVTNNYGSATSPLASIEVLDLPLIVASPVSTNVVLGGTARFQVQMGVGGPFTFQWYYQSTQAIAGATSTELIVPVDSVARAGTYEVEVTNLVGPIRSQPATLGVLTAPVIVTQPTNVIVARGGSVLLSAQATGNPAPHFSWFKQPAVLVSTTGSNLLELTQVQLADSGRYFAVASNRAGFATSSVAVVDVQEPPTLVAGPLEQRIALGGTAQFSVQVQGTGPFTYLWSFISNNSTSSIPGTAPGVLQIPNVQLAQAGLYTVEVRNAVGSVTSDPVSFVVLLKPSITLQPLDQLVAVQGNASLQVAAEGSLPIAYQWQKDGVSIPDAVLPRLDLVSLAESQSGFYRVVLSNEAGSVTSRLARVEVQIPPTLVGEPAPGAVRVGGTIALSVLVQGAEPLAFQWFKDGSNAIPGAVSASLVISNATLGDTGLYSVLVTNRVGLASSTPVLIRVLELPNIVEQPQDTSGGLNGDATFRVLVSGGVPFTYQWYRGAGVPLANATNALLRLSPLSESMEGGYFVIAANDVGSVTSRVATLDVKVVPTVVTHPQSVAVVVGGNAQFSVQASGPGQLHYQWYFNALFALENATNAVLTIPNAQVEDAGDYLVEVSNADGSVRSRSGVLKVVVAPSIVQQPQNQLAARGGEASFSVVVGGTPEFGYQWFFNQTQPLPDATNAVLNLKQLDLANTGDLNVVVSNMAGMVTSRLARLTVLEPVVITQDPQPRVVIQGESVSFQVTATGAPPISYQWSFEGVDLVGATSSTLTLSSVTAANEGNYAVRVFNAVSQQSSQEAPLVVILPPVIESAPVDTFGAVGGEASFTVDVAGTPPFRYQWFFEGVTAIGGGTNQALVLSALTLSQSGHYSVVVSNDAGAVTSSIALLQVLLPPQILASAPSQVVRAGTNLTLAVDASGSEPLTYQWSYNGSPITGATQRELVLTSIPSTASGTYLATVSNRVGQASSTPAVITVQDPPVITQSPLAAVAAPGGNAVFEVVASGSAPLAYQWFFNSTQLIPDASGSRLTLTNVGLAQVGLYRVLVSNAVGTAESVQVPLVLKDPPSFVSHPASQSIPRDTDVTFAATVVGDAPIHLQWLFNGSTVLVDETNLTLTLSGVKPAQAGFYSLLASNEVGRALSLPAVLKVIEPLEFLSQPADVLSAPGSNVLFSATLYGTAPYQLQWYRDETNVVDEATNLVFSLLGVGTNDIAGYSLIASNELGAITSRIARLEVVDRPYLITQPQTQTLSVGGTIQLSVLAGGASPLTYLWYRGDSIVPGVTGPSLAIPNAQPSDSGDYRVVIRNPVGKVSSVSVAVLVLQPPVIVSGPISTAGPLGGEATLGVNITGSLPMSFQWFRGAAVPIVGATQANLTLTNLQLEDEEDYYVEVSNPVGTAVSETARVKIKQVPILVSHPTSLRVFPAAPASFTVTATGSGILTYQWFKDGTPISGAVGSSFGLSSVSFADGGEYWVEVTNEEGTSRSRSAFLVVLEAPSFVVDVPDAVRPTAGSIEFAPQVRGSSPLGAQWFFNQTVLLSGATQTSLLLSNLTTLDGGFYSLVLSNGVGMVTSRLARLQVINPPSIVSGPNPTRVPLGGSTNLSVQAIDGGTLSYQWFFNSTIPVIGATSAILPIGPATLADAGFYHVVVSNLVGSITSAPVSLVVVEKPVIDTPPSDLALELGGSGILTGQASGTAPLAYQWIFNDVVEIAGATNPTLSLVSVTLAQSGSYRLRVRNDAGEAISSPAVVSVLVPPQITVAPLPLSLREGQQAVFSVQASGTAPFQYQWYRGINPIAGAISNVFQIPSVSASDADVYLVEVRNPAGIVRSLGAKLDVLIAPFGIIPPASQTVRRDSTLSLSVIAGGTAPLRYQWRFQVTNLIAQATNAVFEIASAQKSDSGDYSVVVSNDVGEYVSPSAIIEVLDPPEFVLQPSDVVVRTGSNAVLSVTAAGSPPLSYRWRRVGDGFIAGATNRILVLSSVTAADAGLYEAVIANPVGELASTHALLSVLDVPTIISVPGNLVIASGQTAVREVLVSGSAPLFFQWLNGSGLPVVGQTNNVLNLPSIQISQSGLYRLSVSNAVGTTLSSAIQITVLDAPLITTHPLGLTVAQGATATLSVRAAGSNLRYQWFFKGNQRLEGQTNSILTFASAQPANMGEYTVTVTNEVGSVTSLPAALRVIVPGEITGLIPFGDSSTLFFESIAGLRYTLEYSDGLETSPWLVVAGTSKRKGTGSLMIFFDPSAELDYRFYRLRVE